MGNGLRKNNHDSTEVDAAYDVKDTLPDKLLYLRFFAPSMYRRDRRGTIRAIGKKIKKALTTVVKRKKRRVIPDMPADPKELARAMFWENDLKRMEKEQGKQS